MSNPSITADKTPWYQWDTGLTVTVSGGEMNECHFANRKQGTAYVQAVINGVARVPDELLQVAAPIKVYGYVSDGAGGQTYIEETLEVIARNIPADYTYTKTAQKTIRDAEVARDQAVQSAKDAKASELAAYDSAIEASTSAQSAGDSASAAATSESNAAKSAGDAAKSASDAKAAASKTVEDASELLKTYTDNAKTSADNAATSASNAADAASAASGSASAAEQSSTDASNAKVAAQTAKSEAEAAKGEAATSASNAATSADAAAKSASDAASVGDKTLSEAKKYTDENTSNALVGTVSGNLLHVEDAWPSPLLSLTIEGAYKQDGTPSPDNPVPIEVIEHPVLWVTGRNICDEVVTVGNIKLLNATFKNTKLIKGIEYTISLYVVGDVSFEANVRIITRDGRYINSVILTQSNTTRTFIARESGYLNINGYNVNGTIESVKVMLELGSTATDYEQYVGASLPITLPAEHPYLAKLPDGTCDTIEIDKDGNVSLVARTYKTTLDRWFDSGDNYYAHTLHVDWVTNSATTTIGNASAVPIGEAGKIWFGNTNFLIAYNPREDDTIDIINALGIIAYLSQSPVTYPLGKLDIPALPETISNVWTDAELTTNMSMTYKRDINIAFDNLVQAVVAAAAGE